MRDENDKYISEQDVDEENSQDVIQLFREMEQNILFMLLNQIILTVENPSRKSRAIHEINQYTKEQCKTTLDKVKEELPNTFDKILNYSVKELKDDE